ncbi:MAG: hypothetical protein WCA46_04490 [Actinocatenispora sp.]
MGSPKLTRRGALVAGVTLTGAALTGLVGCRQEDAAPARSAPNPLVAVLARTSALLASYEATVRSHPDLSTRLTPLRADHRRHVAVLTRRLRKASPSHASASPSSTPSTSPPPVPDDQAEALAALTTAERDGLHAATTACLRAPGEYVQLLGSIAACRATHLAVLA